MFLIAYHNASKLKKKATKSTPFQISQKTDVGDSWNFDKYIGDNTN